jgi:putative ABC transport system substrate-binding protein
MSARWLVVAGLALLVGGVLFGGLRQVRTAPPRLTIGVVQLTAVDAETFDGFKEAMAELGFREGKDVRYRFPGPAGSIERLDAMIAAHLAAKVDLLLVSSTPAAQAAKRATAGSATPVVFAPVNDPLKAGVVRTLQAPGGNVTGVRLPQGDALRLQWLLKVAPHVKQVLFTFNPDDQSALESLRQMEQVSGSLGVSLLRQPVADLDALPGYLRALPPEVDALLLPRDSSHEARVDDYVAAALARRLPLCAPSLTQVRAGALLSYGFVHREIGRQAARMAVQVIRGIPPAELPVETARSYLAVNLATARAIGVQLPDDVLRQAHLVIR